MIDDADRPLPLGLVGMWAAIGVVAAVILVRLRNGNFGFRVGAALFAIGGTAIVLLCASARPGAPFHRHVDEAVSETRNIRLRRAPVSVHGCVLSDSLERRRGTDDYRFRLGSRPERPPAVIRARYSGVLRDLFGENKEIVAKGWLAADGSLDIVPDGIMARCPSKYDGPPGPPDCLP
jgi:cytochrome c-type biogenesis protein CcmE